MSIYDDYNEKDQDQEIYMGALVSPGGGDWEKSIEVPCIILSTFTLSLSLSLVLPIVYRSYPTRR